MADKSSNQKTDERYQKTLGWQRNNPGNIMVRTIAYAGKSNDQPADGPISFISMDKGLRALAMDLKIKMRTKTTITDILTAYAPSSENDTAKYITYVAGKTGKGAKEALVVADDTSDALMQAIVSMEIGYGTCPFTDKELKAAVEAAKTSQ